jgi:orotate phosphoribosyltransferase
VRLHYLATWWDILSVVKKGGYLGAERFGDVESCLRAPASWSAAHGGAASFPAAA